MVEILNIEKNNLNLRKDICHRITSSSRIIPLSKDNLLSLMEPFIELVKSDKITFNLEELKEVTSRVMMMNKKRVLRKDEKENGGYILIGSLTFISTLIVSTIVFMAIKFIVLK